MPFWIGRTIANEMWYDLEISQAVASRLQRQEWQTGGGAPERKACAPKRPASRQRLDTGSFRDVQRERLCVTVFEPFPIAARLTERFPKLALG
jgi:hypothetical protein